MVLFKSNLLPRINNDLKLTKKESKVAKFSILYLLDLLTSDKDTREYVVDCFRINRIDDNTFYIESNLKGRELVYEALDKLRES